METLLKDNAGVNLEQKGQQLFFNLWKCHQWGNIRCTISPVKFVEELNPELKRIAISFINGMANANGIATILDGDETDMVLDWLETEEWDEPETETRNRLATVRSYRKGKNPQTVGTGGKNILLQEPARRHAEIFPEGQMGNNPSGTDDRGGTVPVPRKADHALQL